tara:strand:+ start:1092 stop:1292 length:201 start_codon:yes stop_codon:yes gene_type:complete
MATLMADRSGESVTGLTVKDLRAVAKREAIDISGLKTKADIMKKLTRVLGTKFYSKGGLTKKRKKR